MMAERFSGGCQCGAVRFAAAAPLGRASICHCRMCQKAFAGPYGALVAAPRLDSTRGAPAYFQSSNRVRRGFCAACGTPLTYEPDVGPPEVAIVAFDEPGAIAPVIQHARATRLPWTDDAHALEWSTPGDAAAAAFLTSVMSNQHPDHDTERWPPSGPSGPMQS
jgi:hypothetical protein